MFELFPFPDVTDLNNYSTEKTIKCSLYHQHDIKKSEFVICIRKQQP